MKNAPKAADGKDVDKYLSQVPKDQRAALQKLRKLIKSLVPQATERISYQIPMFYYNGPLVSIAAFKNHCSFFVQSLSVMNKHKAVLKSYETTKSAIHFTPDKPLPVSLVKMFVKARLTENEARPLKRKKK
jgi:uncharacterized protein YdhG (YjbR/CyaY superfamily)